MMPGPRPFPVFCSFRHPVRFVFNCLVIVLLGSSPVFAEPASSVIVTAVKEETVRLRDESAELLSTPFDMENNGLYGTLAVAGAAGVTYVFDRDIRDKLQGIRGEGVDKAADAGSFIGNPLLHLGTAALLYGGGTLAGSRRWAETGLMMGEAAVLADAAGVILKTAIGRGRPFVTQDKGDFAPFRLKSEYDAMPSLHTASSFAVASVMAATSESLLAKTFYYGAATFVGFSRMYEDKHWASDVIVGAAIGELCGRVVTHYHARKSEMLSLAPAVSANSLAIVLQGRW